ncbi:MAG: T9SS type A sorting domain-containing protein [Candidatus Azobacteroides sp.]|nr:T9SS type A sorting domain-containing protein [Candidatus Azobacteroides sp.]
MKNNKRLLSFLLCLFPTLMIWGQENPDYIIVAAEHPVTIEEDEPGKYLDYRPGRRDIDLFLWEGTCVGETLDNPNDVYEGGQAIRIIGNAGFGWFGLGFASEFQNLDVSMFERADYILHFAIRSEAAVGFFLQMDYSPGIPNAARVDLADRYAFARDGEWHRIEIPMSAFLSQGIDWSTMIPSKNNFFSLIAEGTQGGEVVDLDYIYFYKNEPETVEQKSPDGDYANYVLVATEHPVTIDDDPNYLDLRPNNSTSNMYVWEATATGIDPTGEPFEGSTYTNLRIDSNWFGIGFASSVPDNYSTFAHKDFILHFAVKTTANMPLFVKLEGATGAGTYHLDFPRDGQWHLIEVPMNVFYAQGLVWDKEIANNNYFSLISEDCNPGDIIGFDHVMFYSGKRDYDGGGGMPERPVTPEFIIVAAEHTDIDGNPAYLDLRSDDNIRQMYIWENTATGNPNPSGEPYEGASYTEVTTGGNTWFGLGFVSEAFVDYDIFVYSTYKLHFAIKTTSEMPLFVKLEGAQGAGSVYLQGKYAFPRDGEWHVIEIPLEDFFAQGLGWSGPVKDKNYFSIVSENNVPNSTIGFDDVYFEKTGENTTGIEEGGNPVAKETFSVYQMGNTLYVENTDENATIELINLNGITVKRTANKEIYVGDLLKGVYIIKAGSKVAKVMIN